MKRFVPGCLLVSDGSRAARCLQPSQALSSPVEPAGYGMGRHSSPQTNDPQGKKRSDPEVEVIEADLNRSCDAAFLSGPEPSEASTAV